MLSLAEGMVVRVPLLLIVCIGSLAGTAAYADGERGRDLFRLHCIGCHAIECNRQGPMLGGVLGRRAGTVPDFFGYSPAMKASGIVWDEESLNEFLTDPEGYVPGNGMAGIGGLDDGTDRADIIRFLSHPDTSLDLCF